MSYLELPSDFDVHRLTDAWANVFQTAVGSELETELRREITTGHPLVGVEVHAVAVRRLRKEVIFWLPAECKWAVVHLTWAVESDVQWPTNEQCATWDEVIAFLVEYARA